jgi:hypothetical protein
MCGLQRGLASLIAVVLTAQACHSSQRATSRAAAPAADRFDSANRAPAKVLYTRVRARSAADSSLAAQAERTSRAIDSLAKSDEPRVMWIAELPDDLLVRLKMADTLPASAVGSYTIISDSASRIARVTKVPVTESGDWYMESTHYFDTTGSTIVMRRHASFFNGCTFPANDSTVGVRETVSSYFDPTHRLVRRTFVRTLFDDTTPAPTDDCNESFQIVYPIYPTLDSLIAATGLANLVRTSR